MNVLDVKENLRKMTKNKQLQSEMEVIVDELLDKLMVWHKKVEEDKRNGKK